MRLNKLRSTVAMILSLVILLTLIPFSSVRAAATVSMSVSGTAEVGKTITVSLKVSGTDGPYSGFSGQFVYNSNLLTLTSISTNISGLNWLSNISLGTFSLGGASIPTGSTIVSAKFTCKAAGDTTISLADFEVDANYSSASRSITIKTPVPLSSNANLSSLKVSPGTLSPSFSSSRTSYSMSVAEDVSKVTVTAVAEHSKAKVTLNGVQNNIKPGTNTIKITVKAEDGTTKVYSIKVNRATGPTGTPTPTPEPLPLMVYGDEELMILPIDEDTLIPEGFTASTATYKGAEIPVFKGPAQPGSTDEIFLVQLLTEEEVRYFVYDPENQMVYPLLFVKQPETSLRIISAAEAVEVPLGYEAFPFVYEEEEVTAYRLISDPTNPQILLYVMDGDGEAVFYYYDTEKQMLLPYRGETVLIEPTPTLTPSPDPTESVPAVTQSDPVITMESSIVPDQSKSVVESLTDLKNPFTIMFYLVGLIAIVLAIAVAVLMLGRKSEYDGDYEDEYLPDEEPLPPLAVYSKSNRKEQAIDPDDVFEERAGNLKPRQTDTSYIPSIVRLAQPNPQPVKSPNTTVQSGPVADTTPVMGVRAIHMDNIPELFENQMPDDKPAQESSTAGQYHKEPVRTAQNDSIHPKPGAPVQATPVTSRAAAPLQDTSVNGGTNVRQVNEEHIPVRLKQELDAEKDKTKSAPTSEPISDPMPSKTAVPKPAQENPPLDFPDLTQPPAEIDPDID